MTSAVVPFATAFGYKDLAKWTQSNQLATHCMFCLRHSVLARMFHSLSVPSLASQCCKKYRTLSFKKFLWNFKMALISTGTFMESRQMNCTLIPVRESNLAKIYSSTHIENLFCCLFYFTFGFICVLCKIHQGSTITCSTRLTL